MSESPIPEPEPAHAASLAWRGIGSALFLVLAIGAGLFPSLAPQVGVGAAASAERVWSLCELGGQLRLPAWGSDPWGNAWRLGYASQADRDYVAEHDPMAEGVEWPDLSLYSTGPDGLDQGGAGDDVFPKPSLGPILGLEFMAWTSPYLLAIVAWLLIVRDLGMRLKLTLRLPPLVATALVLAWRSRGTSDLSQTEWALLLVWLGVSEALGRGICGTKNPSSEAT